jgi:hypothetical protein
MNTDIPGMRAIYPADIQFYINLFIAFGLLSVVVTIWTLYKNNASLESKYLLLAAWGIIPPIWFLVEYFFLFLPNGVANSFDFFRYGQDVASKVWGGIFALISIDLYKHKDDKSKK